MQQQKQRGYQGCAKLQAQTPFRRQHSADNPASQALLKTLKPPTPAQYPKRTVKAGLSCAAPGYPHPFSELARSASRARRPHLPSPAARPRVSLTDPPRIQEQTLRRCRV